ncbi:MAG TPA: hypothetical protein VL943_08070, partial [Niabella sp.]|nr:hypothetical protein [Niabella sp.]
YLRVRVGDGKYNIGGSNQGKDAIDISLGKNIIVDHCSVSWSLDELLSASSKNPDLDSVSVQWCFITEALNPANHGFGSLIRGTGGARYSYHHNLYANNKGRNPRPGNYDSNPFDKDPDGLLLDFRNNVIYNWGGEHAGYNADKKSVTFLNYIDNYLISGPDSEEPGFAYSTGSPYNRAHFSGNYYNGILPENQWDVVKFNSNWSIEQVAAFKQNKPFDVAPVHKENAAITYKQVLESGGATLPKRDAVDSRVVKNINERQGKIIETPDQVGGWPVLNSVPPPVDSDGDGMPDQWEQNNGLDPRNSRDRNNVNADGYTMLEKYLNSIK